MKGQGTKAQRDKGDPWRSCPHSSQLGERKHRLNAELGKFERNKCTRGFLNVRLTGGEDLPPTFEHEPCYLETLAVQVRSTSSTEGPESEPRTQDIKPE